MTFEIILLSRAKTEILDTIFWYESRQKGLGKRFLTEVERVIQQIRKNPEIFPESGERERKLKKAVLRKFPFLIL